MTRRRLGAVVVALLVVGSVVVPALGVALASSADRTTAVTVSGSSPVATQATTTNASDGRLLVVRLDPATVDSSMERSAVIDRLRRQARETQPAVVDYAEERPGVTVVSRFWLVNAVLVRVDPSATSGADPVGSLSSLPDVTRVHENFEVERSAVDRRDGGANATPSAATYGVEQVNAPAVWETFGTRGEGVTVAVLDTGIDPTHPDLTLFTEDPSDPTFPGGWAEFDAIGARVPGSQPADPNGLGTGVSGVLAGDNASGEQIGVAPGARLIAGKIFDVTDDGGVTATFAQVIAGIQWAVDREAEVASFGAIAGGFRTEFVDPVRNAAAAGTLVVAPVGGDGVGTSGSPGNVLETLTVGATDENRAVPAFSAGQLVVTEQAWGAVAPPEWPSTYVVPDLAAPGVDVRSAAVGGGYTTWSGTGVSIGFTAGVAALVESAAGADLSPRETTDAMTATATKPTGSPEGQDTRYGWGIPDALAAAENVTDDANGTPDNVTVALSDATVGSDGNGTTFLYTDASGVAGYQARITFDPGVIQIDTVAGGDLPEPVVNVDNDLGVLFLTSSAATGVDAPDLARIEFSVPENSISETEIGFDRERTLLNGETGDIPITRFRNATVTVGDGPPGDGNETSVSLSDVAIQPGETATTTLSANASGVAGYQARITFDPSVIQVENVAGADFADPIDNVDNDQGVVFLTQAAARGQDDPDLATIEVRAVGDAASTTTLTFDRTATRLNSVAGDIPIERFEDATVSVGGPTCTPGDANRDGSVTPLDATLVSRAIVGLPTQGTFDETCADISGDGQLSSIDVTLILRAVVGLPNDADAEASTGTNATDPQSDDQGQVLRP